MESENRSRPEAEHTPVLLAESVEWLAPERGGCFVDCTVGLGGHAEAFLERSPGVRLVAIDRDEQALSRARRRLERFGEQVSWVTGRFGDLGSLLTGLGIEKVDGVFADLGVSSMQLEIPERGFSFRFDGPLDMRMGTGDLTAADVVNTYSEEALVNIFREYGEERQARRLARAVTEHRSVSPLQTTEDLCRVIERVKGSPPAYLRRKHPATQAFQALRIEVNQELEELDGLLGEAVRMLDSKGRLVIISYHSLEDRMVKNTFRNLATGEVEPVTGRPRLETRVIEVLTRKPVRPGEEEVARNPRSRSARLRAARRL